MTNKTVLWFLFLSIPIYLAECKGHGGRGHGGRSHGGGHTSHGYGHSSHGYGHSSHGYGHSGTGSGAHSYPSGSGLSGTGSGGLYSSSGHGTGTHSYPPGPGYSGTNNRHTGYGFRNHHTGSSSYQPGYSFHPTIYHYPQHVYVSQYRDSDSRYRDLLTGLSLYNMGRSHGHHHINHFYRDEYYRTRHYGSDNSDRPQDDQQEQPKEEAMCALRIVDNGKIQLLKIPCEIVSTFTEGNQIISVPSEQLNKTVCNTNITVIPNKNTSTTYEQARSPAQETSTREDLNSRVTSHNNGIVSNIDDYIKKHMPSLQDDLKFKMPNFDDDDDNARIIPKFDLPNFDSKPERSKNLQDYLKELEDIFPKSNDIDKPSTKNDDTTKDNNDRWQSFITPNFDHHKTTEKLDINGLENVNSYMKKLEQEYPNMFKTNINEDKTSNNDNIDDWLADISPDLKDLNKVLERDDNKCSPFSVSACNERRRRSPSENNSNILETIREKEVIDGNKTTYVIRMITSNETIINTTVCTTSTIAMDPLEVKGAPVEPSNIECFIDIQTRDSYFRNKIDCNTLIEYSKKPLSSSNALSAIMPERTKLQSWLSKPPWWMSAFIAV